MHAMTGTAPSAAPSPNAVETLATRLSRWAAEKPGQLAIIDGDLRVTWRELDQRASAIASLVAERVVQPPARVAVLLRDRAAIVAACLGVTRSGNVLVVLDPSDPDERLRFVAGDCEAALLVSETSLMDRARSLVPQGCAVADAAAGAAPRGFPPAGANPTWSLAYTSGSTGVAKGVIRMHASYIHFVDAFGRSMGLVDSDRLSNLHSPSFGAGQAAMARSVGLGLTLCCYDINREGIEGLGDWLDRERVTVLQVMPAALRELSQRVGPKRVFPHLRLVQIGSDTTFAGDFALMRQHTLPHCRFLHQLSATEASVVAQHLFAHDAVPEGVSVPIGRPFEGIRIELWREDGTPVPAGEVGEIVAFGRDVSPGYWKRPELDAAAFVPDPQDPLGRGYRMRDLGRFDEQGLLHFVGRTGTRIKIRGHSVDLAEVDAALVAWPDAVRAAAAAEPDPEDATQMRLVAYVEVREGARRDPRALMAFLGEKLPRPMLPSELRFLAELPRTGSGKIDRKRMAAEPVLAPDAAAYVAPRDATEAAVAHMFVELLKLERAGRDDDFFLAGGDSMLAGELQTRIKDAFGVRLTGFHDEATVAGIATSIRDALAGSGPRGREMPMLVPLWQAGKAIPLFMVHGRQGQAFVSPHFMKALGDDQPVWAFQARGLDGRSAPHASVDEMARDYAAEIRRVRPQGPYFLGGLCVGCYVVAAVAQNLKAAGEAVLPLLLLDPPNRVSGRTAAHADPEHIRAKMQKRRSEGRLGAQVDDPGYVEVAIQTAAAFNDAVSRYMPRPYDGPAYVLSSRHRMQMGDPFELRRYFTGRVKRYEVGNSHNDALDARNPQFAATLKRCIELILSSAPVSV